MSARMSVFDKDNKPLADKHALQDHIAKALAVTTPAGLDLEIVYRAVKYLFDPVVTGKENIPDRPCLFVGNHSLFALDGGVVTPLFLKEIRRFPRAMGDKFLFSNRTVGNLLLKNGVVMGHPDVCTALMEDKQDLLLFPRGRI